jgi:hypothetical protein
MVAESSQLRDIPFEKESCPRGQLRATENLFPKSLDK